MSWERTHLRWRALRDVGAAIEAGTGDDLPWDDRLQGIFGDRRTLVAALRYRLRLTAQAQLDPDLSATTLANTRRALAAANRGLLGVLARFDEPDGLACPLAVEDELVGGARY